MNQGNAAAIPTTSDGEPLALFTTFPEPIGPSIFAKPVDPILALATELRETNRLLAALLDRQLTQVTGPATRQNPATYQTIDKPR